MLVTIIEYMNQTREERRSRLKLDEPCDERGLVYSYHLTGLLAYLTNTSIPKKGDNAIVCHGCNNAKCSNPNHLYWGSYKDNHTDQVENGTWDSPYARAKKKYSTVEMNEIYSNNAKGNKGNKQPRSEEHKRKISESMKKVQQELNPNLGKVRNKVECPHCGKQGAMNTMSRWHFDNCLNRRVVKMA